MRTKHKAATGKKKKKTMKLLRSRTLPAFCLFVNRESRALHASPPPQKCVLHKALLQDRRCRAHRVRRDTTIPSPIFFFPRPTRCENARALPPFVTTTTFALLNRAGGGRGSSHCARDELLRVVQSVAPFLAHRLTLFSLYFFFNLGETKQPAHAALYGTVSTVRGPRVHDGSWAGHPGEVCSSGG